MLNSCVGRGRAVIGARFALEVSTALLTEAKFPSPSGTARERVVRKQGVTAYGGRMVGLIRRVASGVAILAVLGLLAGCDTLDDGGGYGGSSSSSDSSSTSDGYASSDSSYSSSGYDSQQQAQDQQNQDQIQLDTQAQDQAQSDQIQSDLYAQ
jgi:hypothetical protein